MAPADKLLFTGQEEPAAEEISTVIGTHFTSDTEAVLKQLGWDGASGCCCIGLTLAVDNDTIDKGVFMARGALDNGRTFITEASKIWAGASSGITLVMKFPDASLFTF